MEQARGTYKLKSEGQVIIWKQTKQVRGTYSLNSKKGQINKHMETNQVNKGAYTLEGG